MAKLPRPGKSAKGALNKPVIALADFDKPDPALMNAHLLGDLAVVPTGVEGQVDHAVFIFRQSLTGG